MENTSTESAARTFQAAIVNHDEKQIRLFLSNNNAKELLLAKVDKGFTSLHIACSSRCKLPKVSLQLLLDAAVKHRIIERALEEDSAGWNCLHLACSNMISVDPLRLLLEYSSKHADIKKMLESRTKDGLTCPHVACFHNFSSGSFRLLLSYSAKHADIKKLLESRTNDGLTCLHYACHNNLSADSFCLLLEDLSKHADIKKLLESRTNDGLTCLHYACHNNLSADSFCLLLEDLSKHADIKKMLEMERNDGLTCLQVACVKNLSTSSFRILLEYSAKYADNKKMFRAQNKNDMTCLHFACASDLAIDPLRLLLEYLSKHADIKKMLEEKNENGWNCLHIACLGNLSTESIFLLLEYLSKYGDMHKIFEEKDNNGFTCLHYACAKNLAIEPFRLLISLFSSNDSLQLVLGSSVKNTKNQTPIDFAETQEHKKLLQDPDCWQKCRYWLFRNYQETFLTSLYPNSPEKTLEALKELNKNYADDESLKKAILHQQNLVECLHVIPDPADFAQIETKKDASASGAATSPKTADPASADLRSHGKPLSEEERDRQELEKLIFDRAPINRLNKEAISVLVENGVTIETFFLLNENHLKEMGVKIGPRVQLLQLIEQETLRRNNLSARSNISSRPRSSGHTPRIGVVPSIALNGSALIQRHEEQQHLGNVPPFPPQSSEASGSDEQQQRSFVVTANNSEVDTGNGGSESYQSGPTYNEQS